MNFSAACLVVTTLTIATCSTCFAADSSQKIGWSDLKKFASDVSLQSNYFHVESAIGQSSVYNLDYSTLQAENIDRLTRHQDVEPAPLVRFGFKSSGASDAAKITQRMLQSLMTDGTIGVTYAW